MERSAYLSSLIFLLLSILNCNHAGSTAFGQQDVAPLRNLPTVKVPVEGGANSHKSNTDLQSVVATAHVVDYPRFLQLISDHSIGKILTSTAFQPFREELANAGFGSLLRRDSLEWRPLGVLTELAQHDVVVLVTQKVDHDLDCTVVLESRADHSSIERAIAEAVADALDNGAIKEAEKAGVNWRSLQLGYQHKCLHIGWTHGTDEPEDVEPGSSNYHNQVLPTIVCVSSSADLVSKILNTANSALQRSRVVLASEKAVNTADNLIQPDGIKPILSLPERVVASFTSIQLPVVFKPGEVGWYWNPRSRTKKQSDQQTSIHIHEQSHSAEQSTVWDAVQHLQGTIHWPNGSTSVAGEILVKMEGSRYQGMFDVFADSGIGDLPNVIPSDNSSLCSIMSWNMSQVILKLGTVYDRVTETPGAFAQTLTATKEELGVDMERDFFSVLGPVVQSRRIAHHGHSERENVFIFTIQQPDVNAERISQVLTRLFAEDSESRAISIDGHHYPLWRINLDFDSQQDVPMEAGVMVVGTQLWCSTSANSLVQLLKAIETGGTNDIRQFKTDRIQPLQQFSDSSLFQLWTETETAGSVRESVLLAKVDCEEVLAPIYKQLKSKGLQGLRQPASVSSQALAALLDLDGRFGKVDFTKLPKFEHMGGQLGQIVSNMMPHANGWKIDFQQQDRNSRESLPKSRK